MGDFIMYGRTGVCRVKEIRKEQGHDFYALKPLYKNVDILTPVGGKVFMRPVITKEEAQALIDQIPNIQAEPCERKALRELSDHYQAAIATHDCQDLFVLTMSIYAKKQAAQRQGKKFGAVDERFMKEGEDLLFGELAVALDITPQEVPKYIERRLKDLGTLPNPN